MNNYIQYVACKLTDGGKPYLFYAPFYASIKSGDEVLVDTNLGTKIATVQAVCSTSSENVEIMLRVFAGAEKKSIKRVIGKYEFTKFEYGEDENNG